MAELVQLAPLQIRTQTYFDFLQYFIDHIDEFAHTAPERRAIEDWKRKDWAYNLLHYPHQITSMQLEQYYSVDKMSIFVEYKCNSCYDTIRIYDEDAPIEVMLMQSLAGHLDFIPWYEELQYPTLNYNFKYLIVKQFLDTYPPAIKQKWSKMGIRLYKNE